MRFGGEIHRSTCRYKYQTRPRSLHPPISSFVGLCVDVASLRICCVSWVLQGFETILVIVLRSLDLKMQENMQEIREMGAY